jgi:hypothetical chaperone protein
MKAQHVRSDRQGRRGARRAHQKDEDYRCTAIGIDFGTTNSSVGRASLDGQVQLAEFPYSGGITESYRSLLYLDQVKERGVKRIKSWSGPSAIEEYLSAETKGRLIQSLKSFLTSRTLKSTEVFGRRITLQELIARILRDLREQAEAQFGAPIDTAVVGRPVRFVGAEKSEDNAFAEGRLREAFEAAGFRFIAFELEPVAAAHHYESLLDHDELILIGDFGGGTSDFSLLRVKGGGEPRRIYSATVAWALRAMLSTHGSSGTLYRRLWGEDRRRDR